MTDLVRAHSQTPRLADYLRTMAFFGLSCALALPFLLLFPFIFLPESIVRRVCMAYLKLQGGLLSIFCGIRYRVTGLENLPDGAALIASQHESTWETLYFQMLLDRPVMYAKEDIFSYPVFGPLTRKFGHIPVSRSGGGDAMREGFRKGAEVVSSGRKLLIFPTGTRRLAEAQKLQSGVGVVYQLANAPLVPVLVNSGQCWPHGTWIKFSGTIDVEILPPIPAGLPRPELMERLRADLARAPTKAQKDG
ncbi:1-acyl-sn-glycerol-3-phosphate acyltransferase [Shimia isoporae]|uniref:1-acyl-sn-glycerol-3-phosphate acyltransferase n=1 Tax=Shimia isoporae TaxID=647720 RepID=A0A4R1N4C3_9RHOB|nr:lysophospholipid acyltransferase family protein [Shimia isoporae]TCL01425.1 1-acyl-sn-glycerol-3-phosphate acyltransferase [Shimia isoporae]